MRTAHKRGKNSLCSNKIGNLVLLLWLASLTLVGVKTIA